MHAIPEGFFFFFFHLFSSLSIFPKVFTSLGNGTFQISIKVSVLSKLSFRHFRQSKACLCPSFPLLCPSIFLNGKGFSDSEKYTFFENNSFILWLCLFFNTLLRERGAAKCFISVKYKSVTSGGLGQEGSLDREETWSEYYLCSSLDKIIYSFLPLHLFYPSYKAATQSL